MALTGISMSRSLKGIGGAAVDVAGATSGNELNEAIATGATTTINLAIDASKLKAILLNFDCACTVVAKATGGGVVNICGGASATFAANQSLCWMLGDPIAIGAILADDIATIEVTTAGGISGTLTGYVAQDATPAT